MARSDRIGGLRTADVFGHRGVAEQPLEELEVARGPRAYVHVGAVRHVSS